MRKPVKIKTSPHLLKKLREKFGIYRRRAGKQAWCDD